MADRRVEEARGRWTRLYEDARNEWVLYCRDILELPEGFIPGPSETAPRIDWDLNEYAVKRDPKAPRFDGEGRPWRLEPELHSYLFPGYDDVPEARRE